MNNNRRRSSEDEEDEVRGGAQEATKEQLRDLRPREREV